MYTFPPSFYVGNHWTGRVKLFVDGSVSTLCGSSVSLTNTVALARVAGCGQGLRYCRSAQVSFSSAGEDAFHEVVISLFVDFAVASIFPMFCGCRGEDVCCWKPCFLMKSILGGKLWSFVWPKCVCPRPPSCKTTAWISWWDVSRGVVAHGDDVRSVCVTISHLPALSSLVLRKSRGQRVSPEWV